MKRKKKKGFTLIELLVVIAIIAILAAVIAPNAFKAIEKSKVSRTLSDLKSMRTAVLQYYADVGSFPGDVGQGVDPGLGTIIVKNNWQGPYLDFPLSKKTAWGGAYDYEYWQPNRADYPEGVWITIHGLTLKSANMLATNCPFTVRSGDPNIDDIDHSKYKVSLKIADWQN